METAPEFARIDVTQPKRGIQLLRVTNPARGSTLADRALIANTSSTRRTGLLKHTHLDAGEGLWIAPCEGVHTFAMKFAIDVLFLSKSKKVLKIRANMPKSRISLCLRASSVLELPAGMAASTGTVKGDQLTFVKYDA